MPQAQCTRGRTGTKDEHQANTPRRPKIMGQHTRKLLSGTLEARGYATSTVHYGADRNKQQKLQQQPVQVTALALLT
jgi:hypothetical protein